MLRIGEFAQLSSISIHMLRNYDKIGLLSPTYIEEQSGYRYYDKDQLIVANQILALKEMGFGLEDIRKIITSPHEKLHQFLQEKLIEKTAEELRIKEQIQRLHSLLVTENEDLALHIVRKSMNAMWVVCLQGEVTTYPEEGILWEQMGKACSTYALPISPHSPAMAVYYGTNEDTDKIKVEIRLPLLRKCGSIDGYIIRQLPEQEVASVIFKGSYSQIASINTVVADWLEQNSLAIAGQTFTIYHNSPGNCKNSQSYITELCFPVKNQS